MKTSEHVKIITNLLQSRYAHRSRDKAYICTHTFKARLSESTSMVGGGKCVITKTGTTKEKKQ